MGKRRKELESTFPGSEQDDPVRCQGPMLALVLTALLFHLIFGK